MSGIEQQKAQENSLVLSAKEKIARIKAMREGAKEEEQKNVTATQDTQSDHKQEEQSEEEITLENLYPSSIGSEKEDTPISTEEEKHLLQSEAMIQILKTKQKEREIYGNDAKKYKEKVQRAKDMRAAPYVDGLTELETTLAETESLLSDISAEYYQKIKEAQRLQMVGEDYTKIDEEIDALEKPKSELQEEQHKLREEISKRMEKLETLYTDQSATKAISNVKNYMSDKYNNVFTKVGKKGGLTGAELGNDIYESTLGQTVEKFVSIKKSIEELEQSAAQNMHVVFQTYTTNVESLQNSPEVVQAKKVIQSKGFLGFLGKPSEEAMKNAKRTLGMTYNSIQKMTNGIRDNIAEILMTIGNDHISDTYNLRSLPQPDYNVPRLLNSDARVTEKRKELDKQWQSLGVELISFNTREDKYNTMQMQTIKKWLATDLNIAQPDSHWTEILRNFGTKKAEEVLQGSGEDSVSIQKYLNAQGAV